MTYDKLAITGAMKECDAFQSVLSLHRHFNSSARQTASQGRPARFSLRGL